MRCIILQTPQRFFSSSHLSFTVNEIQAYHSHPHLLLLLGPTNRLEHGVRLAAHYSCYLLHRNYSLSPVHPFVPSRLPEQFLFCPAARSHSLLTRNLCGPCVVEYVAAVNAHCAGTLLTSFTIITTQGTSNTSVTMLFEDQIPLYCAFHFFLQGHSRAPLLPPRRYVPWVRLLSTCAGPRTNRGPDTVTWERQQQY